MAYFILCKIYIQYLEFYILHKKNKKCKSKNILNFRKTEKAGVELAAYATSKLPHQGMSLVRY